jgi:hypothetical protein
MSLIDASKGIVREFDSTLLLLQVNYNGGQLERARA